MAGTFNQVVHVLASGEKRKMSPAEFKAMPLGDRVRALLDRKITFFMDGVEVSPHEALRSMSQT